MILFLISIADLQILDSRQALFLPVGASVSLLMLFYFFDSMQFFFTLISTGKS
jgi:hypothetical protein